jgi:hypothetical protein
MSRYANVPVGQWTGDILHYCDILFARRLKQADHVLWFSPGPSPDLGGNEDYDPTLCMRYPLDVQYQLLFLIFIRMNGLTHRFESSGRNHKSGNYSPCLY